jgi:hypothetical protein
VEKHVPVAAINVLLGNASCGLATIDPIRLAPAGGPDLLCCRADARITAALAVGRSLGWIDVRCEPD